MKKLYINLLLVSSAIFFQLSAMEEKKPIAPESKKNAESTETQKLLSILGVNKPKELKFYAALPVLKQYSAEEINTLAIPEELKRYLLDISQQISVALLNKVIAGDVQAVKTLLTFGANPNAQRVGIGTRALIYAAWNSRSKPHKEIARMLIEKGADVNVEDWDGNTPLILASKADAIDIIELLLEHGADPNHQDKKDLSALAWAKNRRNQDAVNLLEKYGAKDSAQE